MCARVLACPLCSQPGFLTLDALRAGLVSVATRPLICPVCNEVLLGIDKLTIHLFGHTINLDSGTAESSKSVVATNEQLIAVHNAHNVASQDWNILRQLGRAASSNRFCTEPSDSGVPNVGNDVASSQSKNQNSPKCAGQSSFASDYNDVIKVTVLPQSNENHNDMVQRTIANLQQGALKVNCATQYFCNDNIKRLNVPQEAVQTEKAGAVSDLIIATKVAGIADANIYRDIGRESNNSQRVEKERPTRDLIEEDLPIFQSVQNVVANVCMREPREKHNDKESLPNTEKTTTVEINAEDQNQNMEHRQTLLPHVQTGGKAFRAIAPKERTERCNVCGFHFPDTNILALHKQLVHEQDSGNGPEKILKNYSCHLCSKVFKMRGSLMVHMRVAHVGHNLGSSPKDDQTEVTNGDAGYTCPTCGKKFKKEQHVVQHLKIHEGKQWECDTCGKMFTTKYFLKKHKRLHSGEMPYKCKICDKSFTFQQSYHKHRLYHRDDKPHTCATCGRSFKELSTLHNHERIHTGEKPFACETCGKCFRQRVSYLVHRRIHTGVMPYKCTMCDKSFRYKVSQRTHKCPVQTSVGAQQLISDTRETDNGTVGSQQTNADVLQKSQSMTSSSVDSEENKYVLIINVQGQPVLALQSEINNISSESKEQGVEFRDASNEISKSKTWDTNNLNSAGLEESAEPIERVQSNNEKIDAKGTNDFFSMVMSPLETSLSSPTFEMEHLRVSSPKRKEDPIDSYADFPQDSDSVQMNLVEQGFSHNKDDSLQTINEESLKELLYGIDRK